jgi:DNA-binding FadR family transcriptional regulator
LILNSIRELYVARWDDFARIVEDRETLAPLYAEVAQAIRSGNASGATAAMGQLAAHQEEAMRDQA